MPIPPDYDEPTKKPKTFTFPQLDWAFLLVAGIACVLVSDGDLTAIGNQLTGSALTAFRFIVKQRHEDED